MKPPQLGRARSVELNVTPLIDVVFLLIIFFLVSSHLARQETQVELDLPTADSGLDDLDDSTPRVTISVRGDGSLLLGGTVAQVDEIADRLAFEQQRQADLLEVRLRADRNVPYGALQPLLQACAAANVRSVQFAVTQREP